MANLIKSVGYSLGKVHAGMIAYLCDLHREGSTEPLESFLGALGKLGVPEASGVTIPPDPTPRREWNSVDLAIFAGDAVKPSILIEVKVDDREHRAGTEEAQTKRYADRWPECGAYLYMTFGSGEFFRPPSDARFTWIKLEAIQKALQAIQTKIEVVDHWREEVNREVEFRNEVARGDRSRASDFRSGAWNLCFLGLLVERLRDRLEARASDAKPTCYTWGQRPDTILNFGWNRKPVYLETNYNGRLNLKITLSAFRETERKEALTAAQEVCRATFSDPAPRIHGAGRLGKSKTVASFDIGLENVGGVLGYRLPREETDRRILHILAAFHAADWPSVLGVNATH